MRADLNKQLCERERRGSRDHYKHYRRLKRFNPPLGEEGEDLPFRESTCARYADSRKDFNENLNPLLGAIRVNVGKPWNRFYSELCQIFDKRSVVNQHILQHLKDFVALDIAVQAGELYRMKTYGRVALKHSSTRYYVDPRDGILRQNAHYRSYRMAAREQARTAAIEEHKTYRKIDESNVLRRIEGVWFHFTMAEVPQRQTIYEKPLHQDEFRLGYGRPRTWQELGARERERFGVPRHIGGTAVDIFTGEHLHRDGDHVYARGLRYHGTRRAGHRYHASKRTASRKLLKRAGL